MGESNGHVRSERQGPIVTVTLDRPEKRNALALDVMLELTAALRGVGESRCARRHPRRQRAGVLGRSQLRRHGRGHARRGPAALRRVHGDDGHDPGDPAAGVSPRSMRSPPPPAASSSPRATSRSPPSRPASPSRAARAGCSATRRSSPSPATSVASGRWRWRSPATPSTPRTAAEWGLINRAVPDDELDAAVADLMARATRGIVVVEGARQADVLRARSTSPQAEAYEYAIAGDGRRRDHRDAQEGIAAFLEKRRPKWPGRDA